MNVYLIVASVVGWTFIVAAISYSYGYETGFDDADEKYFNDDI